MGSPAGPPACNLWFRPGFHRVVEPPPGCTPQSVLPKETAGNALDGQVKSQVALLGMLRRLLSGLSAEEIARLLANSDELLSLFVRITRLPKVERDRLLTVLNALLPAPSE